jgi:hypothetical protein
LSDIFSDKSVPLWFKLLNIDESHYERSQYADPGNPNKFRIKDPAILQKLAPGLYEAAAGDVKEYNDALLANGKSKRKYKIGKKLGSIPLIEAMLKPELMNDPKAQEKYWRDNPGLKCDK